MFSRAGHSFIRKLTFHRTILIGFDRGVVLGEFWDEYGNDFFGIRFFWDEGTRSFDLAWRV